MNIVFQNLDRKYKAKNQGENVVQLRKSAPSAIRLWIDQEKKYDYTLNKTLLRDFQKQKKKYKILNFRNNNFWKLEKFSFCVSLQNSSKNFHKESIDQRGIGVVDRGHMRHSLIFAFNRERCLLWSELIIIHGEYYSLRVFFGRAHNVKS